MLRLSLLLATASIALYFAGGPSVLLEAGESAGHLVSSSSSPRSGSVFDRPAIRVLSAPTELELGESGQASVQAEAPAQPGATIILRTAGAYGLGYNKVSSAVLDDDLRAALPITGRSYLGSYRYWVTIPASSTYQEGNSASWTIKIRSAAPAAPTCGGDAPLKADGTPWECTYDDEFSGNGLDRRFWVPQVTAGSGFTTGTNQVYACAEDRPDTVAVRNGNLELSLVDLGEVRSCGKKKSSRYAFGQVMHYQTFSQTYGKYEVRAFIPDIREPGVQQSFWLWPTKNRYGPWPASGEIDFAEMYSYTPGLLRPYIHYLRGENSAGADQNRTTGRCPINVGEYNTYGVEWIPGQLKIMLNGEVCFTNDYTSAARLVQGKYSPFDGPFYLALTQAIGDIGNEYDPDVIPDKVTTRVDYVRIWK